MTKKSPTTAQPDLITLTYQYLIDEHLKSDSVINLFAFEAACHLDTHLEYQRVKDTYQIQTMANYYQNLAQTNQTLVQRLRQQNIYQSPKIVDLNVFKEERRLKALQAKVAQNHNQYALLSVYQIPGQTETVLTYQRLLELFKLSKQKD